ncbi:MAG: MFS transporter [Clostridia bacterium]|nr:MFS transporter [Clostridia bacterium]
MKRDLSSDIRRQIWKLRLVNLFYGMASACMSIRLMYLDGLGLSPEMATLIMCVTMALGAVAPPLWGMVADSIRSKYRVFILTMIGSGIVCALIPVAEWLRWGGAVGAMLLVPMTNMFLVPTQSLVDASSVSAAAAQPAMDYSNLRMWMSMGFTTINFLYTPLMKALGNSSAFLVSVICVILLFTQRKTIKQYEEPVEAAPERRKKEKQPLQLSRLFKSYYLIIFLAINVLIAIPQNASQFLAYLLTDIGSDTTLVGLITACRVVAEIFILLISPKLKRFMNLPMLLVGAAVCFSIEMLGYQVAQNVVLATISFCFGGAAYGFVLSSAINYVHALCPEGLEATAVSLWLATSYVAGILVMLIGGAIVASVGVRVVYLCCLGCTLLWVALFLGMYGLGRVLKIEAQIPLFERKKR